MPTDEALLELPELETPEETPELEGAEPIVEGSQPVEGAEGAAEVTSLFQPDGKKLDPTVSAALAKLKTENPSLGKLMVKAVYKFAELEREFPGGLTEARELRDKMEEFGGVEAIEKNVSSLKEFDALVDLYKANDPAFVEDLVTSYPENFAVLAPVFAQKWAETNPEAYAAHLGRAVFSDMQRAQVPLILMRLVDVLGDNPKATELVDQLNTYLGGFKTLAEKKPEAPAQRAAPKPAQPERTDTTDDWQKESASSRMTLAKAEAARIVAGRATDAEDRAQIFALYKDRAASLANEFFKDWQKKATGFLTRGDRRGYLRYMKSIDDKVVPLAVQWAVARTLKTKAAPAGVVKKQPVGGAPVKGAEGFIPVAKEPDTWGIDYNRTTKSMLDKNQAVLKDGKKVTWR